MAWLPSFWGFLSGAVVLAQQHLEGHRLRELGSLAEATVDGVVLPCHRPDGVVQEPGAGLISGLVPPLLFGSAQHGDHLGGSVPDVFRTLSPGTRRRPQNL